MVVVAKVGRSLLLLAWEVSADQEEPWRRLLQKISDARRAREEVYVQSRRSLGVSTELVWLVPTKPRGKRWR